MSLEEDIFIPCGGLPDKAGKDCHERWVHTEAVGREHKWRFEHPKVGV